MSGKYFVCFLYWLLLSLSIRVLCVAICQTGSLLYLIIIRVNRISYGFQIILMTLTYYWRILLVYKETIFRLRRCTIWFYRLLFTIFISFFVLLNIEQLKHRYLEIIGAGYLLFYMLIMISLCILFIHKLFKVHSRIMSHENIAQLTTKMAILALTSVIISLIC